MRVGRDGDRTAVWLWGEHDVSTAGLVGTALVEAIAGDDADVVVDLDEVAFLDASILAVLVHGRELLGGRGRRLTLRSPQRGPRRVLELCGLAQLIEDAEAATSGRAGVQRALETWVEVPAAGRTPDEPQPARRDRAWDDPKSSRR